MTGNSMRTGGRWSPIPGGNPEGRLKRAFLRSGRGQPDLEPGAATGPVRRLDRSAVAFHDPRGDRQSETGPGGVFAGRPPKAVEHPRQVLRTETRARVLDPEPSGRLIAVRRHGHDGAFRRVADRVVDQDPNEL